MKAKMVFTKEDYIKANRKASREENLGNGWVAKHNVHKSVKYDKPKYKHKIFE